MTECEAMTVAVGAVPALKTKVPRDRGKAPGSRNRWSPEWRGRGKQVPTPLCVSRRGWVTGMASLGRGKAGTQEGGGVLTPSLFSVPALALLSKAAHTCLAPSIAGGRRADSYRAPSPSLAHLSTRA